MKTPTLGDGFTSYEDLAAERFDLAAKLNKPLGFESAALRSEAAVRYKHLTKLLNSMYLAKNGLK